MVQRGATFNPENFEEGEGLPPPGNYRVVESRFVSWDYRGKAQASLALLWKLVGDDQQPREQYYSAGRLDRFTPSPDGLRALPVSTATAFQKSANISQLMEELVNVGFPVAIMEQDDASNFDGLYAYFGHVKQQVRAGLTQDGQPQRERMLLIPQQIHSLPGQAPPVVAPPPLVAQPVVAQPTVVAPVAAPVVAPAQAAIPVAPVAPAASVDPNDPLNAQVVAIGNSLIQNGAFTRADLANAAFTMESITKDVEQAIVNFTYTPEFVTLMATLGLKVEGEVISR